MERRDTWMASSRSLWQCDEHDLSALVGMWNENLDVVISYPATVTQGPVTQHGYPEGEPRTLPCP